MTQPTDHADSDPMRKRRRHIDGLCVLLIVLASVIFSLHQVHKHDRMSPIDEYQYVDYLAKVKSQGVLRTGEEAGWYTKHYSACHGVRVPDVPPDPNACANYRTIEYPLGGGNTADLYTPAYFWVTRAIAQPYTWAGYNLVDAGRAAGGWWLAAAASLLFLCLRRLNVNTPTSLGLSLVVLSSLPAYWSNTYVSTDASALLAGSVAVALTLGIFAGKRWCYLALPVAAAIAVWFKLQNLSGFAVAAVLLLFQAGFAARTRAESRLSQFLRDRRTLTALGTVAAGGVAQVVWLVIRANMAVGPPATFGEQADFAPKYLLAEIANFVPGLAMGAVDAGTAGVTGRVLFLLVTAIIASVIGLALGRGIPREDRFIGASTLLALILSAPALSLAIAVSEGIYYPLPARYGTAILPWAAICAGLFFQTQHRWAARTVLILGGTAWVLAMFLGEHA